MTEDEELASHELAVGGTRPALMPYLGIPWRDFCIFFMAGMEALIYRWQFLIPISLILAYSITLYRKDYNAGRCFVCWLGTGAKHMGAHHLGGTFISPRPGRGFRGVV